MSIENLSIHSCIQCIHKLSMLIVHGQLYMPAVSDIWMTYEDF